MTATKRELKYAEAHYGEVLHTTLNPEGPGVVRIHLIPPETKGKELGKSVAIVNGQDVIPVNPSWSILLSAFIGEVNRYEGRPINEDEADRIVAATCAEVKKVYPLLPKKRITTDLYSILETFRRIARGEEPEEEIGYMSLVEYAPYMRAPHRMDLMVSAMTKNGGWHCNQKCVHCYAAGQERSDEKELSTEEWKTLLDRCRAAGIPQVTFTGGEPTMRDDLTELIDHARWFVTRLNTNGIRLTPALCEDLKKASLDSLQVTFYSSDPGIHNRLVGTERYADTLNGIKNALAAGLNLSINTPLCTLNRDYVKTLAVLKELGVRYVTCSGIITTGNALGEESSALQMTAEEMKETLTEAVSYCFENGMEISFTSPGWFGEDFFDSLGIMTPSCGACLSNMAITPGGNVVPCQSWLNGEPLGNLLTDPWEKIWTAPECVKRRNWSSEMLGICPLRRSR